MRQSFLKSIKQFIHRTRVGGACIFGSYTTIDSTTIFEGKNSISNGAIVLNSTVGLASYIGENSFVKNAEIGRFTCISKDVDFVSGTHPVNRFASNHPAFYSTAKQSGFTFVKENKFKENIFLDSEKKISVRIGNDVWIGSGVTIVEGISIGDGAIVAAGAIVTKDVQPYSIVGGVPAKLISYRYEKSIIDSLLKLCWWDRSYQWLEEHVDAFESVEDLIEVLNNK